jgi:hypothetical protein
VQHRNWLGVKQELGAQWKRESDRLSSVCVHNQSGRGAGRGYSAALNKRPSTCGWYRRPPLYGPRLQIQRINTSGVYPHYFADHQWICTTNLHGLLLVWHLLSCCTRYALNVSISPESRVITSSTSTCATSGVFCKIFTGVCCSMNMQRMPSCLCST